MRMIPLSFMSFITSISSILLNITVHVPEVYNSKVSKCQGRKGTSGTPSSCLTTYLPTNRCNIKSENSALDKVLFYTRIYEQKLHTKGCLFYCLISSYQDSNSRLTNHKVSCSGRSKSIFTIYIPYNKIIFNIIALLWP